MLGIYIWGFHYIVLYHIKRGYKIFKGVKAGCGYKNLNINFSLYKILFMCNHASKDYESLFVFLHY